MRYLGTTIVILVALLLPTRYNDAQPRESREITAAELMRQVVATYHSLSTYSDRGISIAHLNGPNGPYEVTVEFETLFKRPRKLRFEWTLKYSYFPVTRQNLIWCDGVTAWSLYSFHHDKNPRQVKDLGLVVAGAIAVSEATVLPVLRLLSDEVPGIRLDERHALRITGNDTADGVDCFVVVGEINPKKEIRAWIGRKDLRIRRIEERAKDGIREEVRTQIVVNQDIPDSRFSEKGH